MYGKAGLGASLCVEALWRLTAQLPACSNNPKGYYLR